MQKMNLRISILPFLFLSFIRLPVAVFIFNNISC